MDAQSLLEDPVMALPGGASASAGAAGSGAAPEQGTRRVAERRMPTIICCLCGVQIPPNPASMCIDCLRSQVDITEGIPRELVVNQCRNCERYQRPPWVACGRESRELLALLLKKIAGLQRVKLVDAGFLWTEPHSKRLRVRLVVEKDTDLNVRLQQDLEVEFQVRNLQCTDCQKSFTEHTWGASVQLRQKVDHKRTFYYLEQLILRTGLHENANGIDPEPQGVDFKFKENQHAVKFLDYLGTVVPLRTKQAKQLVSHDEHTSSYNWKRTYMAEIAPICKDDLVLLPPAAAAALGSISPLVIVFRVTNYIYVVDPLTLQTADVSSDRYWREQFHPLRTQAQLEEFVVIDSTPVAVEVEDLGGLQGDVFAAGGGGRGGGTASVAGSAVGGRARATRQGRKHRGKAKGRKGRRRRGGKGDSDGEDDGDDGDDGVSMITSLPGGTRSVSVGLGGMGGVVHGRRVYAGAKSGRSTVSTTVHGGPKGKFLLGDVEVARARDLGENDERFIVRTHLGHLLKAGDSVLGYDLTAAVIDEEELFGAASGTGDGAMASGKRKGGRRGKGRQSGKRSGTGRRFKGQLPDIVLVRKLRPKRTRVSRAAAKRRAERERRFEAAAARAEGRAEGDDEADEDEDEEGEEAVAGPRLGGARPSDRQLRFVASADPDADDADFAAYLDDVDDDEDLQARLHKAHVEGRRRAIVDAANRALHAGAADAGASAAAGAAARADAAAGAATAAGAALEEEGQKADEEQQQEEGGRGVRFA